MGRGELDLEEMRLEKLDRESKEKDSHRSRDKDKDAYKEVEKERDRVRERDRDKEREREQKDKDKSKDAERDRERHRDKEKERDKESERDKQRAKDRDREKEKEREREREKEREKERERDREREREKERDKEREREREKDRDRERLKERERERERDKIREKEREKARERDSRLRELEKDKDGEYRRDRLKDTDRDIERDRDTDKEKRKERDRDRDRKDREREKEKERDVERDRDRDDRERERERKKEKEKDREKDRDREREKEREVDRDRDNREHPRSRQKGHERERDKELEKVKDRTKEIHLAKEKDRGKDEERSHRDVDKSQISAMDLEERIVKMKEDRIKNLERRKAAVKEDEQSEITAWVNRSRKLQEQVKVNEREKAARMARTLAEQEFEENKSDEEYETKDLAGLKIRHGLDKVMEGGAVVLTLKDRNILDGDDVDEEMDELENIEIAEQNAREDAYKAAKKKPGVYEDKFHNDFNEPRTILPQYDDVVKDDGVILDETGGMNEESRKRLEEIRQRLQNATVRGLAQDSIASEAARVAADFYTQEEMLQFKKPKKKKKLRKKVDIDIDALEAEAKAAGLGSGDLGSRVSAAKNSGKKEEERAVADSKRNAYQNAYVKALEASKVLRSESSASMDMDADGPVFGADEDDELYISLERARFAALKKQAENGGSVAGPQAVAARLAALKEESGSGSQHQGVAEGETEKPVVITDTGEFCLSLQLDEVISRRAGAKDVFGEEDDVGPAATKDLEVSSKEGGWIEVKEVDEKDSLSAEEEEEAVLEEPIQEVAVGKGLAGALNLLKERGTLKETVDWGGRNMDKKRSKLVGIVDDNPPEQTRQRDILLDRVDEFGRTMTPKEAFRRLSHKFHGKGPGKMKQEKKMKQYQEELKLKQMNSGDTPLMSMEKMREAQAKMHTPYIVISGHIKPGQTSDPRSGFATVEKEPIGSLTPMLGDKKVEHFLGIKRKTEVGSMGPPPPKKPKSER